MAMEALSGHGLALKVDGEALKGDLVLKSNGEVFMANRKAINYKKGGLN